MEDRHVVFHDLNRIYNDEMAEEPMVSFYGVYDGHAGKDAAAYASSHLHVNIIESEFYPSDPVAAIKDGFKRTDEAFIEKGKSELLNSGTTAICTLIRGDTLYTAWAGDSQAVLVRNGSPVDIVVPHKPNRRDENDRIREHGGFVIFWGTWRVNGQLAVSRAIGDSGYKPWVSSEPDVTTVKMNGTEDFIILGCDGLWDSVTSEEARDCVFQHLKSTKGSPTDTVSARLVELAKSKGSVDNISIVVVFLRPLPSIMEACEQLADASEDVFDGVTSTSVFVGSQGRDVEIIDDAADDFSSTANGGGGGQVAAVANLTAKKADSGFISPACHQGGALSSNDDDDEHEKEAREVTKLLAGGIIETKFHGDDDDEEEEDEAGSLEDILAAARNQPDCVDPGLVEDVDSDETSSEASQDEDEALVKLEADPDRHVADNDRIDNDDSDSDSSGEEARIILKSALQDPQVPAVSTLVALDEARVAADETDSSAPSSLESQQAGPSSVIVETQEVPDPDQALFIVKPADPEASVGLLPTPQEPVVEVIPGASQSFQSPIPEETANGDDDKPPPLDDDPKDPGLRTQRQEPNAFLLASDTRAEESRGTAEEAGEGSSAANLLEDTVSPAEEVVPPPASPHPTSPVVEEHLDGSPAETDGPIGDESQPIPGEEDIVRPAAQEPRERNVGVDVDQDKVSFGEDNVASVESPSPDLPSDTDLSHPPSFTDNQDPVLGGNDPFLQDKPENSRLIEEDVPSDGVGNRFVHNEADDLFSQAEPAFPANADDELLLHNKVPDSQPLDPPVDGVANDQEDPFAHEEKCAPELKLPEVGSEFPLKTDIQDTVCTSATSEDQVTVDEEEPTGLPLSLPVTGPQDEYALKREDSPLLKQDEVSVETRDSSIDVVGQSPVPDSACSLDKDQPRLLGSPELTGAIVSDDTTNASLLPVANDQLDPSLSDAVSVTLKDQPALNEDTNGESSTSASSAFHLIEQRTESVVDNHPLNGEDEPRHIDDPCLLSDPIDEQPILSENLDQYSAPRYNEEDPADVDPCAETNTDFAQPDLTCSGTVNQLIGYPQQNTDLLADPCQEDTVPFDSGRVEPCKPDIQVDSLDIMSEENSCPPSAKSSIPDDQPTMMENDQETKSKDVEAHAENEVVLAESIANADLPVEPSATADTTTSESTGDRTNEQGNSDGMDGGVDGSSHVLQPENVVGIEEKASAPHEVQAGAGTPNEVGPGTATVDEEVPSKAESAEAANVDVDAADPPMQSDVGEDKQKSSDKSLNSDEAAAAAGAAVAAAVVAAAVSKDKKAPPKAKGSSGVASRSNGCGPVPLKRAGLPPGSASTAVSGKAPAGAKKPAKPAVPRAAPTRTSSRPIGAKEPASKPAARPTDESAKRTAAAARPPRPAAAAKPTAPKPAVSKTATRPAAVGAQPAASKPSRATPTLPSKPAAGSRPTAGSRLSMGSKPATGARPTPGSKPATGPAKPNDASKPSTAASRASAGPKPPVGSRSGPGTRPSGLGSKSTTGPKPAAPGSRPTAGSKPASASRPIASATRPASSSRPTSGTKPPSGLKSAPKSTSSSAASRANALKSATTLTKRPASSASTKSDEHTNGQQEEHKNGNGEADPPEEKAGTPTEVPVVE